MGMVMDGTKVLVGLLIATTVTVFVALLAPLIGSFGTQNSTFSWDDYKVEFWDVVDYRIAQREIAEENGQKKLVIRTTMLPGPTKAQVKNTLLKVLKDEAQNDPELRAVMVLGYTTDDSQLAGINGTLGKVIWGPGGRFCDLTDKNEAYQIDFYSGNNTPELKRLVRQSSGGGGGG